MPITTRHEAMSLVWTNPLPRKLEDGFKLVIEEVFIAPNGQTSVLDAVNVLEKIKAAHPKETRNGKTWRCEQEGVFLENGRYFAYRYHGFYEPA